ncbi:MAG: RagB/SusD family nutrient uptake outer membrane protein [Tannerella sp.]|jgi:hypothetical protein|nr:RagB/SusD family nutrient uptake outer membrane protein [Tannerella sp.]
MKHKTVSITAAWFVAGFFFVSCNDFLDQKDPNKITASEYFQNENDVLRAVNGIYRSIRDNYCLGEGSTAYTEERSDNTGTQDNQSSSGEPFQFGDYSLLPANTYLKTHWTRMFAAIANANFVLTYIDGVKFPDENVYKQYRAEAKFLRALVYFHVVRKWGDAPLSVTHLTSSAEVAQHTFREKKEIIYEQIVKDLTEALDAGSLPDLQPASGKGRTCRAAINALLGQVYLTMAVTLDGSRRRSDLEAARKYLTEAYSMRTFGELKEIPYPDVFDVEQKGACPELIFQIVYIQGDRDYSSAKARGNQPRDSRLLSQYASTGSVFLPSDLIKEYEAEDLRREWSVQYSAYSGSYYIAKFRDAGAGAGTLGYGGNDWILMRYADVMLLLAETCMHLGDEAAAISLLNQVRERAGLPAYEDMQNDADYRSKYPTLKLALLHERRVELAFENHRWYDLLRNFNILELEQFFHSKTRTDFGISNPLNFGRKDLYYPIPFDEWKLNPEGMYQNEGYE